MEDLITSAMEDDGSFHIISRSSGGSFEELSEERLLGINFKSVGQRGDDDKGAEEGGNMASETLPEVTRDDNVESEAVDGDMEEEGSLDLEELNNLLKMEENNLEAVKMMNENLAKMLASVPPTSPIIPPIPDAGQQNETFESAVGDGDIESDKLSGGKKASSASQNAWRKLTNFRRRRQQRLNQPNPDGLNPQRFLQDYYRSLDTVSRYLIASSVIGFCVAFILLSWHGSQTHRNDMEMFKLKEKQYMDQQSLYEKSQERHENFREGLIHQRYEETRECHSTLKSYLSGRDGLLQKISKMEKEAHVIRSRLEATVESQHQEILELQRKLQEMKIERAQSLRSSYMQIVFGFLNVLKNPNVQSAIVFVSVFIFLTMTSVTAAAWGIGWVTLREQRFFK